MESKPLKIESLRPDPENTIDGYVRRRITGPSAIYKATLDIVLCHMADFHKMTFAILCKKYGLDLETVLTELEEDPTYKELLVHPLMRTLTYMADEDVDFEAAGAALGSSLPETDTSCKGGPAAMSEAAATVPEKKPRRKLKIVHEEESAPSPATEAAPPESTNKEIKIEGAHAPSQKATKVIVKKKSTTSKAQKKDASSE